MASKFGKVLVAVRDAESRTRFLGYRVERYKLTIFVVSAVMAGIAGALYVPQVGIINPSEFQPANSIEIVIWAAVGGRAVLLGPLVGAVLVNFAKSYFTSGIFAQYWLFVLGGPVRRGDPAPAQGDRRDACRPVPCRPAPPQEVKDETGASHTEAASNPTPQAAE